MNSQQLTRISRIEWLKNMLLKRKGKKEKNTADHEKLIAVCCEEFKCARRTAREYIKTLRSGGFCKNNKIKIAE